MAWMELLPDMGVDRDTLAEMNKDVNRLSTIASRFSKIGSDPRMEPTGAQPLRGRGRGVYVDAHITKKSSSYGIRRHAARHRSLHATARMGDREPS